MRETKNERRITLRLAGPLVDQFEAAAAAKCRPVAAEIRDALIGVAAARVAQSTEKQEAA